MIHTLINKPQAGTDRGHDQLLPCSIESNPFDLHAVVNRTVHMISAKASEKGLALVCHIGPLIPFRLIGDRLHLIQALSNLLDNAIKFTDRGRVTLLCKHLDQKDCSERIRFKVIDTGIGIPESLQQTILESIAQTDADPTGDFSGTGRGINISSQLVRLMGGQSALSAPRIRVQHSGSKPDSDVSRTWSMNRICVTSGTAKPFGLPRLIPGLPTHPTA
ncbi:ATP-binding protein [Solemya velesiana gill symbiont]|uniref:histidine kinase n=1 Tax=Solemya velesiana gill symbiont TaxID=1918948 RepID=A0A1T2KWA5_9GAMM|nr:ATP-binding protein [Solemya velesiana gill symbiont]OOZ37104.1 hypothetical protein BOW51_04150 [Solemya velesiana gill symbiont]